MVWKWFGPQRGLEFLTGYLIEKALAVDNIFVFLILFSSFAVPAAYQHRVLLWGILGALVMRAGFILAGAALLARFHWTLYVFGGILLITGVKLLLNPGAEMRPQENPIFKMFQRTVPSVSEYHGDQFTVVKDGRRFATPMLLVLVAIEAADLVFAIDSIPAVFAVTQDPFIVFTSNIFAILGLRALYFLLAELIDRFRFLSYGLGLVLIFVGLKMLTHRLIAVPIELSLGLVVVILLVSIGLSLLIPPKELRPPDPE